jgi:hypothetical protein
MIIKYLLDLIQNLIKGNLHFLVPDSALTKITWFIDQWQNEDPKYYENFREVYHRSELMQTLFEEKDIEFPSSQS